MSTGMSTASTGTPEHDASLWPAIAWFCLAFLLASAATTAVLFLFDITSNSGVTAAILIAATAAAMHKFVADNHRALRRGERWRFALLATLATIVLTLVQLAAVVMWFLKPGELPQLVAEAKVWAAENAGLLAIVCVVVVLFTLAVLYFASGWFSRSLAKRLAPTSGT